MCISVILGLLGASWTALAAILIRFASSWLVFGRLGRSWTSLGAVLGRLGSPWARLGALLARPGCVLAPSWLRIGAQKANHHLNPSKPPNLPI